MRHLADAGAVLLALFGAACASSGGEGGRCRSDLSPSPRSLAEVADSAALQGWLAESWTADAGRTLATVPYDSTGARTDPRIWSETLDAPGREGLARELGSRFPPEGEAGQIVYLVLGDASGAQVRRVEGFASCAPVMRDRDQVAARLRAESVRLELNREVRVTIQLFVYGDGSVGEVQIQEGSGLPDVDQAAERVARTITFDPALVEGIGTGAWTRFPISFRPVR